MTMMSRPSHNVAALLKKDRLQIAELLQSASEMLIGLRYEGKLTFGKNIKKIAVILTLLNREFRKHSRFEEKILFPFVKSHLPKLESVVCFLKAEHDSLKRNLDELCLIFKKRKKMFQLNQRGEWVRKLNESGTFMIYSIRHHLDARREGIEEPIENELRSDEKKELGKQLVEVVLNRE